MTMHGSAYAERKKNVECGNVIIQTLGPLSPSTPVSIRITFDINSFEIKKSLYTKSLLNFVSWIVFWDSYCKALLSDFWKDRMHTGISGLWTQELDTEIWTRGSGRWTLDAGLWTLDSGLWTLDSGRWTLDAEFWPLDAGLWTLTLNSGRWTLDAALWTLNAGLWTLDDRLWKLNARLSTLKILNLKLLKALETMDLYQQFCSWILHW